MRIVETDAAPTVKLKHPILELALRPGSDVSKRREALEAWYREQLPVAVPPLLEKWEPMLGVKTRRILVQHMKTKWGSCNPVTGNIRLNTDLARKPSECVEYILVHELLHLIEPAHNARFQSLMDRFMPQWRQIRDEVNRLPVRHEDWAY
ncbi:putative metal-dependent hydrolase [Burkholderia sp. OAS925]|uniref:M48 family metallopeptidase n=1 Tax=Paraburkholderia sp. OAS925 TaxID=2663827 RepID=UPI0019DA9937